MTIALGLALGIVASLFALREIRAAKMQKEYYRALDYVVQLEGWMKTITKKLSAETRANFEEVYIRAVLENERETKRRSEIIGDVDRLINEMRGS